jgi:hypothetical protein
VLLRFILVELQAVKKTNLRQLGSLFRSKLILLGLP